MLKSLPVLFLLLLSFQLFIGCKKVENTTPRFSKDACLICNRFGHEKDAGTCFYCKGDGVCKFCNGIGKRLEGNREKYYETTCSFCMGSGKCHYCEGNGKCKTCGGTGKYNELFPQKPSDKISDSANGVLK